MTRPVSVYSVPQLLPKGTYLEPNLVWYASSYMCRVRWFWKAFDQTQLHLKKSNWSDLLLGGAVDYAIGDNVVLKLAGVPFYLMAKFIDLFEQQDNCSDAIKKWKEALYCVHPVIIERPIKVTTPILGPSVTFLIKLGHHPSIRVARIAMATFSVVKECFILAMRVMDVIDCFTLDKASIDDLLKKSVVQGGVNLRRVALTLKNNKYTFLKRFDDAAAQLEKATKLLHIPGKAEDWKKAANGIFDSIETASAVLDKVSGVVSNVVVYGALRTVEYLTPKSAKSFVHENIFDPEEPNYWNTVPVKNPIF